MLPCSFRYSLPLVSLLAVKHDWHALIFQVVSFCGVVVPYAGLPTFWRSWMYWLTPFNYLLEGFLALLVSGQQIECSTSELAIFPPPPGQDCENYAGSFARQSGGYVQTQPNGDCGFCQFATGDAFAASFNVFKTNIWRDFGISCKFCSRDLQSHFADANSI